MERNIASWWLSQLQFLHFMGNGDAKLRNASWQGFADSSDISSWCTGGVDGRGGIVEEEGEEVHQ